MCGLCMGAGVHMYLLSLLISIVAASEITVFGSLH